MDSVIFSTCAIFWTLFNNSIELIDLLQVWCSDMWSVIDALWMGSPPWFHKRLYASDRTRCHKPYVRLHCNPFYFRMTYSGLTVLIILVNLLALVFCICYILTKGYWQGFYGFSPQQTTKVTTPKIRLSHREEYRLPQMPFGWKRNGAQLFSTRWSPPPLADERKALPDMPPCFFDTLPLCQCAVCVTDCIMPRPAPPSWWPPAKILT